MNDYELTFIIQPDADEDRVEAVKTRVTDFVTGVGGEVTAGRDWGRRRLAYPIRKQTSGFYVSFRLTMSPGDTEELQRLLRLNEDILRYLLIIPDSVPAAVAEE